MGDSSISNNNVPQSITTGHYEEHAYDFTQNTWRDNVTFVVEDRRLYAAKNILAMSSPVFEAMFGSPFKEKDLKEISLPGKTYDGFHEFLHFVYPHTTKQVKGSNVDQLLQLADEYGIKSLLAQCETFLHDRLIHSNAPKSTQTLVCHALAIRYNFTALRELCASMPTLCQELEDVRVNVFFDEGIISKIQGDLFRHQNQCLEDARTEHVKLMMAHDMTRTPNMTELNEFTDAKGTTMKFKPTMASIMMSKDGTFSPVVRLWDTYFRLRVSCHVHEGEQGLKIILYAICLSENDVTMSCEVKATLVLKNLFADTTGRNVCGVYNETVKSGHRSGAVKWNCFESMATILKTGSGFVDNDRLNIEMHILANMPVVQDN